MTVDRTTNYLVSLVHELRKLPTESEWVEFKHNNADPEKIGEYLSALAELNGGRSKIKLQITLPTTA